MKLSNVAGIYFIVILIIVSAVFFLMIKPFLVSILLAALLAGLMSPVYTWIRARIWDQEHFSSDSMCSPGVFAYYCAYWVSVWNAYISGI